MATVKKILNHVLVEEAQKKRRCHHNGDHEIPKGTMCLVVREHRGNKLNYCPTCAKPMLAAARRTLAELHTGLGMEASIDTTD